MQIENLFTDDDAVSPVIGVILMVAITVILAAVIAAFVLGLGDSGDPGPQVSFSYDYDETAQELTITMESGDSFNADRVSFRGTDLGTTTGATPEDNDGAVWHERSSASQGETIRSGSTAVLEDVPSTFDLNIVWTSSSGDDSSTLSSRSGPDA